MEPCFIDMVIFSSEFLNTFGLIMDVFGVILISMYSTTLKVASDGMVYTGQHPIYNWKELSSDEYQEKELLEIEKCNSRKKIGVLSRAFRVPGCGEGISGMVWSF